MYQALYRKWRPRTFEDVVGQDHITTTLKNQVAAGKFSHAYLFTGSRGTGKTTCSKIIAKAVNCLSPVDGNPCNQCEICRGIDDGSILDVVEIDAASNNGVDNIRQLREEAYFLPTVAKKRVYILDECHMLSAGAVNALLKILEEPPEHVIFILATTEIHKVLPTILSRCQRFDFKRIKSRVIADRLLYVCDQEGIQLEDDGAMLIARLADGGMRDALSLLDLCVSYSQRITLETVTQAAGLTGRERLFALVGAILSHDPTGALQVVEELSQNSVDFTRLCEQLVSHYRDLMIVKTVREPDDLVQGTQEELEQLQKQAGELPLPQILEGIQLLQDSMGRISRTPFKRTELEMAVLRLCGQGQPSSASNPLEERVARLERMFQQGAPQQSQPPAAPPPQTSNNPPAAPKPAKKAAVQQVEPFPRWAEVLEQLKKRNGALYGAMVESRAFTNGEMMLVDCPNELFRTLLRTSVAAKESLRDSILAVTGQKFSLGPYNPEKYAVVQRDPLTDLVEKAKAMGVPVEES